LPVNLLLLLLLRLFLVLKLVSNQSTSSRSERTTDELFRFGASVVT
jgi:hypothetical protein